MLLTLDESNYPNNYHHRIIKQRFTCTAETCCDVLSSLTEVPAPPPQAFILHEGLNIGAEIITHSTMNPKISVNTGTILALDDVIFNCCCNPGFFVEPGETEHRVSLNYITSRREYSQRFYDYSTYPFDYADKQNTMSIFSKYPTDIWRFEQADFLSTLAIQWTILHELGHWLYGHCSILHRHRIDEAMGIFDIAQNAPLSLSMVERKCLELQADGLAFELMFYELLSQTTPNVMWQQYRYHSEEYTESPDYLISGVDPEQRIRILLLVSSAVILLFERTREINHIKGSSCYPKPMTRITNLFATAFRLIGQTVGILKEADSGVYGEFVLDSQGYQQYQEQFHQLASGLVLGLSDVALLAQCLQITDSLYGQKSIEMTNLQDRTQQVMFLQQLQQFMTGNINEDVTGEQTLHTMTEFITLLPVQSHLITKLREFSLIEV